jgi:hypothetical protein
MPHPRVADPKSMHGLYDALASRYVDLLHARFPHVQPIADELLARSQTFRNLVEEYGMCADALDRLSHEDASPLLLDQYTALRFDLEHVLLQYLAEQWRSDDLC